MPISSNGRIFMARHSLYLGLLDEHKLYDTKISHWQQRNSTSFQQPVHQQEPGS